MAKKSPRRKTTRAAGRPKRTAAKRPKKVSWLPAGAHVVTPYLSIRGAAEAIEFYKRAFGAREKYRLPMPGGKIGHAEIRIGDAEVFLADEFDESDTKSPAALGGSTVTIHVYSSNVDKAFERAITAGAKAVMPPTDMFWGDRFAKVADPFGHSWSLSQHKENVAPREMAKRAAAMFSAPPQ